MNDPERLLDGHLEPHVAELLRSMQGDVPPAAAENKRRICATAAASAPWQQSAPVPVSSRLLRNAFWIGIAAVIVGAVVVATSSRSSGGAASAAPGGTEPAEVAVPPVPTETTAAAEIPSVRVDELPSAPSSTERATSPTRREPALGVEDELKTIVAAQSALTASRPLATLSQIARYRATFPTPHFSGEADALEVQALAALGRSDEARTKAKRFVATHPDSPYTQRVRSAAALNGGGDEH
jgi:hypothetical protein